jgi:hypothetical protein
MILELAVAFRQPLRDNVNASGCAPVHGSRSKLYFLANSKLMVCHLSRSEILGVCFSSFRVGYGVERHALSLVENCHASFLDGADMNENVGRAIVRCNETEASLRIEKLHSTDCHGHPRVFAKLDTTGLALPKPFKIVCVSSPFHMQHHPAPRKPGRSQNSTDQRLRRSPLSALKLMK